MSNEFDFGGWATRHGLRCSDKRVIMPDAFKHNDGKKVPLMWGHQHQDVLHVLGHAILENRAEGVYAHCKFNNSEAGQAAKEAVEHGDIEALSIYANQLRQQGDNVMHGEIREVSLVIAGANPGAFIDLVIKHDDNSDGEGIIYANDNIPLDILMHASDDKQADENGEGAKETDNSDDEETLEEVFNKFTPKQKNVVYAMVEAALEAGDADDESDNNNEEETEMKHNVFENENNTPATAVVLTHADQAAILDAAKTRRVGTLQHALKEFAEENESLKHGFVDEDGKDATETLFPEYHDVKPGAPELLARDEGWVGVVMRAIHKSPFSRIRTRQADIRALEGAKGYVKGSEKTVMGNIKLLSRTTDPQTVFVKDVLDRDDILDIQDFDVVAYKRAIMRRLLEEKLALSAMIGDGLEDGDKDKVKEEHIRPIWTDDELYTIHVDVDIAAARAELQGSNTSANFGENYIYSEAVVTASLYAREKYKGSGNLAFFCDPHLLNVMLLARDLNGRRIYSSKAELTAALNANAIHTAEQFAGKIRTTADGKKKMLLGLFVNLNDYHFGSVKGGEITHFSQFDIDFNQEKYLIETRLSGALVRPFSAIALEMDVTEDGE
ncbi:MAG: HK97 family phage prohead protease [Bacteroidales bacterium]|nr:HK97 family phage prohead protease [Bacteroidales bacterium]